MNQESITVNNLTRRVVLSLRTAVADTPDTRRDGLLGWDGINEGHGLLLKGSNKIHTKGMKFAIDVVFVDGAGQVTSIRKGVQPGWVVRDDRAHSVLELPVGVIEASGSAAGDQLELHG